MPEPILRMSVGLARELAFLLADLVDGEAQARRMVRMSDLIVMSSLAGR